MIKLFGVPVLETSVLLTETEKNDIIWYILKNEPFCSKPKAWTCDLSTSHNSDPALFDIGIFQPLAKSIHKYAIQYAKDIQFSFDNHGLIMSSMWFNVYREKQGQEKHDHGRSFISCTYIVDAPEGSSDFMCYNPLKEGLVGYPTSVDNNLLLKPFKSQTGKLIIFPGWLEHGVQLNNTKSPRISISCNWNIIDKKMDIGM